MSIVIEDQAKLNRFAVWMIAKKLTKQLGIKQYEIAGSYRRGNMWCNDIDLLIQVQSPEETAGIIQLIKQLGWNSRPDRREAPNIFSKQFVKETLYGVVVLDVFLVPPGCMGNALLFATGPRSFNDKIRENILSTGYTWSDPRYFTNIRTNDRISFSEEASAFRFLGSKLISPRRRK